MSISFAWFVLALAAAVVLMVTVFVMRSGTVAGRARIPDAPGAMRALTLVTLVGISAWLVIPGFAAMFLRDSTKAATTAPATSVSVPTFTPEQNVLISLIAGVGGTTVIVGASALVRPGGLRRLGFSLAQLPRGFAVGFLASLLVLPLTFIASVVTDRLWRLVGLEHPQAHEMLEILGQTRSPGLRALIYASAIVVAPVFEELLFRGHVQTLLVSMLAAVGSPARAIPTVAGDPVIDPTAPPAQAVLEYAPPPPRRVTQLPGPGIHWFAIVVTSVLFALVHGALWMMPPIFFLSLCLGYVYERTANLWASITVHLMFNLASVTIFVSSV
jgi:membrane protease YdiL (CAAX protease family)